MPYGSVRRATGLTATTSDRLGLLAEALEALRGAGVNLVQATAAGAAGTAYFFVVPEQVEAVKQVAASAGITVEEYPALVFEGDDEPGALVDIARKLANAGISVKYCSAAAVAGKYCAVFFLPADSIDRAAALFGL
ncbi:MAG: hypothetical protein J7M26_07315 [Armatimonadetes bacterium]|nr:hypothetical protein [Armatimonadota bacterium]